MRLSLTIVANGYKKKRRNRETMSDRDTFKIPVPKEDMTEEQQLNKDQQDKQPVSLRPDNTQGSLPGNRDETSDIAEEDKLIKDKLDDLVSKLSQLILSSSIDSSDILEIIALLRAEIQTSTSSMTSVPKPLKFLRPHYDLFKSQFETLPHSLTKVINMVL